MAGIRMIKRATAMSFAALAVVGFFSVCQAGEDYNGGKNFSFGPRATWFKPQDGDAVWSGGAQLRWWPHVLGVEGSIDYRREKFGATRVDLYPVQASLL